MSTKQHNILRIINLIKEKIDLKDTKFTKCKSWRSKSVYFLLLIYMLNLNSYSVTKAGGYYITFRPPDHKKETSGNFILKFFISRISRAGEVHNHKVSKNLYDCKIYVDVKNNT